MPWNGGRVLAGRGVGRGHRAKGEALMAEQVFKDVRVSRHEAKQFLDTMGPFAAS